MTVVFKAREAISYDLPAKDMLQGMAYERDDGKVFIGNSVASTQDDDFDVLAFSLDGEEIVIRRNQHSRFRAITLIVEVQENE